MINFLLLLAILILQETNAETTCGSLITYRQFSAILDSAPQCLKTSCASTSELASISSQCNPDTPCYSLWKIFTDKFHDDWCSSCRSDHSCRTHGWPILNATASCEIIPHDWLF